MILRKQDEDRVASGSSRIKKFGRKASLRHWATHPRVTSKRFVQSGEGSEIPVFLARFRLRKKIFRIMLPGCVLLRMGWESAR